MGVERLRGFLRRHQRVGLDTSIFIYQIEANPRYVALTDQIFSWLERPGHEAVSSTITMTELQVKPYRDVDEQRVDLFYARLSRYPNLQWVPPSLEIADLAAKIRAEHRLRTPDALQAATALHTKALGFITNDKIYERVTTLDTLVLEQLI